MRLALILFLFVSLSCSGIQRAKKIKKYITSQPQKIQLGEARDSIRIHYTGCGGFLIQDESSAIMIDPYFSNLSPLILLPFKKLKTDTLLIDGFFTQVFRQKKDEIGKIKAMLISHSHYDHLADIPSIYRRNCNQDSSQIIGSKSSAHILRGANIACSIIDPQIMKEEDSLNAKTLPYSFHHRKNGRIRILPIPSGHAPHFMGIKLVSAKKVDEDFKKFPRKPRKLPEGENYNFLIDFLDEKGEIEFRIFSNAGSACDSAQGFPPADLLEEREVDVLLLCAASYSQVKAYPSGIIDLINPKHIVLNHWENFFMPIPKLLEKPATVPATNLKKLISLLGDPSNQKPEFTMPLPLTEMIFYY